MQTNTNSEITDSYIYVNHKNLVLSEDSHVACFDLDHTIIKPVKGVRFSKTPSDWEYYDSKVINKIKKYNRNGKQIVILSNQKILKTEVDKNNWVKKIEMICHKLNVPIIAMASLKDDKYRKPRTGLWDKFIKCDKKNSFYCGDAGGLPKRKINNISIKKDFSDTDHKLALNLGIKFMHRDEFIFGTDNINYNDYISYINFDKIKKGKYKKLKFKEKHMIICIGMPGSGKSYYSKKCISSEYVYINRDTLKTKAKCIKECNNAIESSKSIIIDNTNPSINDRSIFIKIAKAYDYTITCLNFTTSYEISNHNNIYRSLINESKIIPRIVYNIFKKKYQKPNCNEGFNEIVNMEFILDISNIDKNIYFKYLY